MRCTPSGPHLMMGIMLVLVLVLLMELEWGAVGMHQHLHHVLVAVHHVLVRW